MASIYKRKNENKTTVWRAIIRMQGFPVVCDTFERKQEAIDWAKDTERLIKTGDYNFEAHKTPHTYVELLEKMVEDDVFQHHRSMKSTKAQYEYWKNRLGQYALIRITSELIDKERKLFKDTLNCRGELPANATINRYMATLSSTFSYAVRLRWMAKNPCAHLIRFKPAPGRDRILSVAEITRLLNECRNSKSSYLYSIALFAFTTGARRGEILNLKWRDVDFENRLAQLKETKNGRPRSVALSDALLAELQQLWAVRNPMKPFVFASKTAFGRIDIKKAWMEAVKRAGLENYRFHDTRHQFATLAAGLGASNLELSTATGHRTLDMLQRYTHLDVKVTQKYTTQISALITPQNKETVCG